MRVSLILNRLFSLLPRLEAPCCVAAIRWGRLR